MRPYLKESERTDLSGRRHYVRETSMSDIFIVLIFEFLYMLISFHIILCSN